MGFTFHIQHHTDPATERKLAWIMNALRNIIEGQRIMALDFSALQAEMTENSSAIDSAVALIKSVADELRDAAGNQARINELADQLDKQSFKLSEAIIANTPVTEPAPVATE